MLISCDDKDDKNNNTKVKVVSFTQANLTSANVRAALDAVGVGYNDKWIAVLKSSVEMIGENAFDAVNRDRRCVNLVAVECGDNIKTIGYLAFQACDSLKAASFPKVTAIDKHAFGSCVSLTSLSLETGLTAATDIWFGDDVFYNISTSTLTD